MAKIEAWEQRIRDDMELFANQLNIARDYALTVHAAEREEDPDHLSHVAANDPTLFERLVKPARTHLLISETIKMVIEAREDEDSELLHQAMKAITLFTQGMTVSLEWTYAENGYRMSRVFPQEGDEKHPFVTAALVFRLDDYLARYHGMVHLGVCRYCGTVYLKPKHGRKQRYCSRACQQKAYRVRKAEREEQGG